MSTSCSAATGTAVAATDAPEVPDAEARAAGTDNVRALYFVTGAADPGLLPRLVEPFAKLNLVPHRIHASREDGDGSEVTVDLRLGTVTRTAAGQVERMLRSVVGVRQVIVVTEQS